MNNKLKRFRQNLNIKVKEDGHCHTDIYDKIMIIVYKNNFNIVTK